MKIQFSIFFLFCCIAQCRYVNCSKGYEEPSDHTTDGCRFQPGELWMDNHGVHINAHGGGILFYNDLYYWFGEHKTEGTEGNRAKVGVHCYSSKNLCDWKDEGICMKVSRDTGSLITSGCIIERPKVIYNPKSGKFVMWFHHELKGQGYSAAMTGLAVADKVTGPYRYQKSLRPNAGYWPENFNEKQMQDTTTPDHLEKGTGEWETAILNGLYVRRDFKGGQMARDMTLYVDDDGKAYHIHASEENRTLHISELTDDYQDFSGRYIRAMAGGHNEAPSLFKHKEKYYMITSGCTGWAPNAARLLVADSIMGEWTYLGNPAMGDNSEITFDSQSTFIIPVRGRSGAFIFMADRWRPENAIDGRYVWLPVLFNDLDQPYLEWMDEWEKLFFGMMAHSQEKVPDVQTFTSQFERIEIIRMGPGTDMLEGFYVALKERLIKNGVILAGIGSVTDYHYHVVTNRTFPVQEEDPSAAVPMDLTSVQGYIINGRVHAHMTLSDENSMVGGHVEPGTIAFTFFIITVGVLPDDLVLDELDTPTYKKPSE